MFPSKSESSKCLHRNVVMMKDICRPQVYFKYNQIEATHFHDNDAVSIAVSSNSTHSSGCS